MKHRANESGAIPTRSDRFFIQHNYWYFSTREGMDIGPFVTLVEANSGSEDFKAFMLEADQEKVERIARHMANKAAA